MDYSIEEKSIAYSSVVNSNFPWFTSENIKSNLEEEGFIINNQIVDHIGSFIFTKDKSIKIISIKKDLSENKKRKLLLTYYSYYKLDKTDENYGFVRIYDTKKIKNSYKKFGNLIQNYSVEKELNYEKFINKKEYIKEKVKK